MRTLSLLLPLFTASLVLAQVKTVEPRAVRKLVADGKHNAFTALTRFRDHYWLAFRSGKDHNSAEADLVVLRSTDGKEWIEALRLNVVPDDRDPQFLKVGEKLFLYDMGIKGKDLATYAVWTEDGKTWSKPQAVYEPNYILWKPLEHKGKYYAGAHKRDNTSGGKGRNVHFVVSDNGLDWKKISTIRSGNWESETTLFLDAKGHATALLRQKYGNPPCQILEADAPYTEWKPRVPNIGHMSGHSITTIKGTTYFLSRTMDYAAKKSGCAIYTFEDGKLNLYCTLPAGGDCAYAEAVEAGDDMLVSYYSTHEGTTNIYLATVPLRK